MASLAAERPGWVAGLKPTPRLEVSDWADENRMLQQKNAAEPGPWRTSRTPYLRQIMNDLSNHSPVNEVTLMAGAQLGKTECGNNWIGYQIDHAPGPGLVVQPTVEIAKLWSRQRLAPMIEDMPCLKQKIADARERDSGNTLLVKEYDGGILRAAGANSPAGLRSMPVKNLMEDELDAYPSDCGGEGSPDELATNRTNTFARRKIFRCSTPTLEGASAIDDSYKRGTQSQLYVPCPHCGHKQTIEFDNLKWLKDDAGKAMPETAMLQCIECKTLIEERYKTQMLAAGEWIDKVENAKHKSYQISSLYSPLGWKSWADIVRQWVRAKGHPERKKTFTNTILGLPYKEPGTDLNHHFLKKRAEDFPLGICPMGCLVLTAGVDVQDNRLEALVIGHGIRERWPIDHQVIYGSPSNPEVWKELDDYLRAPFEHQAGTHLSIAASAVDTGGHHTQEVYHYTRLRKSRHIIAVKGWNKPNRPIIGKPSKVDVNIEGEVITDGAELWMVGTDTAKDHLYSQFRVLEKDADGYWHISTHHSDDFLKQLTSEKKKLTYPKGFPVYTWFLPPGKRNEILDCAVYAIAAFQHLGLHRWRAAQWHQLEQRIQPPTGDLFSNQGEREEPADPETLSPIAGPVSEDAPTPKRKRGRRRRGRSTRTRGLLGE